MVFQRPNCGRRKAPPTLFCLIFQTNSVRRRRRRTIFFRRGGGASQSFCLCEKEEISSSSDFLESNNFDFSVR